jgi:hypothetical protein
VDRLVAQDAARAYDPPACLAAAACYHDAHEDGLLFEEVIVRQEKVVEEVVKRWCRTCAFHR